jgi:hypothetical protein
MRDHHIEQFVYYCYVFYPLLWNMTRELLPSSGLLRVYLFQRKRVFDEQWTSALTTLFRLSGVMSQYLD